MDRTLVLNAQLAIALGHIVEVTEQVDALSGESRILAVVDIDTGIRYRRSDEPRGEVSRWTARVLDCTILIGGGGPYTTLVVDPVGIGSARAEAALQGADAAADAAKAEADRWGGTDRAPEPEAERFW